jgi:GT2 family glycosyltransferase
MADPVAAGSPGASCAGPVTSAPEELGDVCVAISSFRNDQAIIGILERLYARGPVRFHRVLVVDSLGTGAVEGAAKERGWNEVRYVSFDKNLGSAGNLAKRLELSAETNARYVYAINHDADVDPATVAKLCAVARANPRLGAVFPLRQLRALEGRYDVTGRYRVPLFSVNVRKKPRSSIVPVHWSSSNGALYSLEPVRRGLLPWDDLWMGWEDLGYGWLLEGHGYEQVVVVDAVADDDYEFRKNGVVWVTDKAPWYAYYFARNFVVVAKRTAQPLPVRAAVLGRVALEFVISAALRDRKWTRIKFLSAGLRDAALGRMHKWRVP